MRIDLNADVGESFGAYTIGCDARLMPSITSASVAAGLHGGDPSVLRATIRLAHSHGVAIGAHPGFPDLAGFGRRHMQLTPGEVEDLVLYQIAVVAGIASAEGARMRHVKVHGALYNMAAKDDDLAAAIARATVAFDDSLILYGPPYSRLLDAGRAAGLRTAVEGFADRAYNTDGSLVSRTLPGAVINDASLIVSRVVWMVKERTVVAIDGSILPINVDTVCVHSDTPGADRLASALRVGLEAASIKVQALD